MSRECKVCGNSLFGMSTRATMCSVGCRTEHNRQMNKERYHKEKQEYKTKKIKNKGLVINHWAITAIMPSTSTLRQIADSVGIKFKKDLVKVEGRPLEEKEIVDLKTLSLVVQKVKEKDRSFGDTIRRLDKLEEAFKSQECMGRKFDIEYERVES